jgi:hypothetical protein
MWILTLSERVRLWATEIPRLERPITPDLASNLVRLKAL